LGVVGTAAMNNGVDGATTNPSLTSGSGRSGVYGHDDSTDSGTLNVGVAGSSNLGYGVEATSGSSYGLLAFSQTGTALVASNASGDFSTALNVFAGTSDQTGLAMAGYNLTNAIFDVDDTGNVFIAGLLYTTGPCHTGCSRTRRVTSYEARESVPSIEDVGEGQIVDGKGRVSLDAAYANIIDGHVAYNVFITPEGPSRGLYVTQKGSTGFTVMENPGGNATIAFSYRIVAKPYGVAAPRLPMTDLAPKPASLSQSAVHALARHSMR
jgi:hypothetical protein